MPYSLPLLYTATQLEEIAGSFYNQLTLSFQGNKTSLPFYKHQIPLVSLLKENERFQVMVFGGTVFKSAILTNNKPRPVIVSTIEVQTPRFTDSNVFLSFIFRHLQKDIRHLAVNFAYPLQPVVENGILDGILIEGAKEHAFSGLIGKKISIEIAEEFKKKYNKEIIISTANDTVCLLLSQLTNANWNNSVAVIIGTGINIAVTLEKPLLVNLESSNFNKFNQTETGKQIDYDSIKPGEQLFEKEVSGAYLFKHFNLCLAKNKIDHPFISTTLQMSEIALQSGFVSEIAQKLLERSASLAACQMAGISLFKKQLGIDSLTFQMEGNLYWQGWNYRDLLNKYLYQLGVGESIQFSKLEHHSIQGAIKLLTGI